MKSSKARANPPKSLTGNVIAAFLWAMIWPGGPVSDGYGLELPKAETVKTEFKGKVVENCRCDSSRVVAEASMNGVVVDGKAPEKKKRFPLLVPVAAAAGAIGVTAYFLVSGGGDKPPRRAARQDSTAMPIDSTRR